MNRTSLTLELVSRPWAGQTDSSASFDDGSSGQAHRAMAASQ